MKQCAVHRYFDLPVNGHVEPAPQELQERLALAFADHQVRGLAQKAAFRITELARKAALDHVIQDAIKSADPADGNDGVVQKLEAIFVRVSDELSQWNSSAKIAEGRAKERSAQNIQIIKRANNAIISRENEVLRLKMILNDARRNGLKPSAKLEAYKAAGLTNVQIAKLGDAGPTAFDLEQAEWQIKMLDGEVQRLNAFARDPLHRLSLLQSLKLTEADDHTPVRFVPPVIHQPGNAK